jgi:hypothetical protein
LRGHWPPGSFGLGQQVLIGAAAVLFPAVAYSFIIIMLRQAADHPIPERRPGADPAAAALRRMR